MSTRPRSPQQINAHYPPYLWPFAKLRNGFGSHRYLYSPILLDSQDLITTFIYQNFLPTLVTPVLLLLYLPKLRWSPMEMQTATISASWQLQVQHASVYTLRWLASGNADGEWRWSSSCHAWCAAYQDP
jgi:hypothetical protein